MPPLDSLLTFLAISLFITFTPGPDNLMVLGQSLARGRAAGFCIAVGCALGCLTHTLWATLGISAILLASPNAFFALKLAGASYLCWLGIQSLRSGGIGAINRRNAQSLPWYRYVARGFVANAINPKVALFFLAFLPQFAQPALGPVSWQMMVLGGIFAVQVIFAFGLVALVAGSIGGVLARRPAIGLWLDRLAGLLFIGLAINLLLSGRRG